MIRFQAVLCSVVLGFVLMSGCSTLRDQASRRELTLERQWVRATVEDTSVALRRTHRMTPIPYKDLIIQGNAVDGIVAYRRSTGREVWRLKIENGVEGGAQLVDDKLFFGGGDGNFYSASADDGRILWSFAVNSDILAPPAVEGTTVYFQSGGDIVYALDVTNGKQNWLYNRQTSSSLSIRASTRPVVDGNFLYIGFSDGFIVALNRTTGIMQWEKKLTRNLRFKDVDATPVLDGDTIYISSYDGSLYALNKKTGDTNWELEEGGYTPATLSRDSLFYSTTTGNVYALDKASGRKIWSISLGRNGIGTQPVLLGGYVVFGESNGALVVADARTGSLLSRFEPGRGLLAAPLATAPNNEIYFISTNGNLFALKLKFARVSDRLPWQPGGSL